jgi:hypothetical protein
LASAMPCSTAFPASSEPSVGMRMFLYTVVSSALGGNVVLPQCPMTGKLQLPVIIPSAVIEKAQEIR